VDDPHLQPYCFGTDVYRLVHHGADPLRIDEAVDHIDLTLNVGKSAVAGFTVNVGSGKVHRQNLHAQLVANHSRDSVRGTLGIGAQAHNSPAGFSGEQPADSVWVLEISGGSHATTVVEGGATSWAQ